MMIETQVCEESGQPIHPEYRVEIQVMDDDDGPMMFCLCPVCRTYMRVSGDTWPTHSRRIRDKEARP